MWITSLEERVAQLVAVGVILKADGVIPFAVQFIVHLHAVALCNLFWYATLCQIAEQRRRLQAGYFKVLKCRLLDKRHGFVRLCHGHIHLFGDVPCLLNENGLARQYPGECEDVAAFSCTKIEPYVFTRVDMERGVSLVAVRRIEPQTFAVAPRRIVAEAVQEIHK